jgi:hypothetical protein
VTSAMPYMSCHDYNPYESQFRWQGETEDTLVPKSRRGNVVIYIQIKWLRW